MHVILALIVAIYCMHACACYAYKETYLNLFPGATLTGDGLE